MLKLTSIAKPIVIFLGIVTATVLQSQVANSQELSKAYFAGGCFWCVEKDFESVPGVTEVVSGFTGGDVVNPKYKQVAKGGTGHVEAVEITYDASVVGFDELLHLFFRSIDPTDAGGQFCDRGHAYTTAVFVSNPSEQSLAETAKAEAMADLGQEIVTPIRDAGPFFPVGEYHQNYYKKSDIVLTRFGPLTKAAAYKRYRKGCGRDARVQELWGDAAPFAGS